MKYYCPTCNKEFDSKIARNSHLKIHNKNYVKPTSLPTEKKPCQFCNKEFRIPNLTKHENACKLNPKNNNYCKACGEKISHTKQFCNKSCAAKFNNKRRKPRTDESKKKTSDSVKKFNKENQSTLLKNKINYKSLKNNMTNRYCKLFEHVCSICNRFALVNYKQKQRKTCSKECQTIASTSIRTYQNGSRKTTWYFNKYQNKDVLLESSWEVEIASLLDSLNIEWIRPKPIKWIDTKNISHLYFPDFYLVHKKIYLDPKNPYCMDKDKEKLSIVSKLINLIYGDLETIKQCVLSG